VPSKWKSIQSPLPGMALRCGGMLSGHAWEQFELPRSCGEDVLLSLCNTGPLSFKRQLAVLHDVSAFAFPSAYSRTFRTWYRFLLAGLMRRAAVIATVSKFSADELVRCIGVRARGIEVIYESGEHILQNRAEPAVIARLGLENSRYVLAVGSLTPNKNLAGVIAAARLLTDLDVKIVAAGGSYGRVFADVDLGKSNLVHAGQVSDGELRALYEHAECFVFPSFYEGFGLPPLEAMHCGCPVVVSNRSSIPEICGDAAVYCDPGDPRDIAKQLRKVLTSDSLRDELREAGHMRSRLFSWKRAASKLDEVISVSFA